MPMKRKVDKNFSCTLDGYMEAKEYLQRKGCASDFAGLNGVELVKKANKLMKAEHSSVGILRWFRSYSIHAIKSLRRKMAYRFHTVGAIISFYFL